MSPLIEDRRSLGPNTRAPLTGSHLQVKRTPGSVFQDGQLVHPLVEGTPSNERGGKFRPHPERGFPPTTSLTQGKRGGETLVCGPCRNSECGVPVLHLSGASLEGESLSPRGSAVHPSEAKPRSASNILSAGESMPYPRGVDPCRRPCARSIGHTKESVDPT